MKIIARLRDKSPLIVEKTFGQGEVILVLTTLMPQWNDWAKNPSFVVVALKMQSYLASARRLDDPRLVGTPLDLRLENTRYLPDVTFVVPSEKAGSRNRIEHNATPIESGSTTLVASLGHKLLEGRFVGETDRPGIYEAWTKSTKGETDVRRWALNVDPDEGDLTPIESAELLTRLDPVKVAYHLADQYQQDEVTPAGYNLSTLVLCTLVLLLIAEQLFAYSASYHVAPGGAR